MLHMFCIVSELVEDARVACCRSTLDYCTYYDSSHDHALILSVSFSLQII
jgi:hypothetical protein